MKLLFEYSPGFSLVELLISTMLGMLLIFSVLTLYTSQKQTYQYTQALERMRENAEAAFNFLSHDIHMAGFAGCGRITDIKLYNSFNNIVFTPDTTIVSLRHNLLSTVYPLANLKNIFTKVKPNTDILIVQEAQPLFYSAQVNDNKIKLNAAADLKNKDMLLVSNCIQAELFNPLTTHSKVITSQQKLIDGFKQVEVSRFATLVYYIADTQRKNQYGGPIYALYRQDLNAAVNLQHELVEDVADMQVEVKHYSKNNIDAAENTEVQIKLVLDSAAADFKSNAKTEVSFIVSDRSKR